MSVFQINTTFQLSQCMHKAWAWNVMVAMPMMHAFQQKYTSDQALSSWTSQSQDCTSIKDFAKTQTSVLHTKRCGLSGWGSYFLYVFFCWPACGEDHNSNRWSSACWGRESYNCWKLDSNRRGISLTSTNEQARPSTSQDMCEDFHATLGLGEHPSRTSNFPFVRRASF